MRPVRELDGFSAEHHVFGIHLCFSVQPFVPFDGWVSSHHVNTHCVYPVCCRWIHGRLPCICSCMNKHKTFYKHKLSFLLGRDRGVELQNHNVAGFDLMSSCWMVSHTRVMAHGGTPIRHAKGPHCPTTSSAPRTASLSCWPIRWVSDTVLNV